MKREYHSWHSPALGIEMPLIVYGHWGLPLVLFPTSGADCEEYERFGLIDAIAHHIDGGKIKIYAVDSINRHSWLNEQIHPAERARRQALYDAYIYQEVSPFIFTDCRTANISITTCGASFGAYHAMNTLFKHPDRFRIAIGMSGAYDMKRFTNGFYDDNVYFNNPVDYLPNLSDPAILDQLHQCSIHILTGQGQWEFPQESQRLSEILRQKGIGHTLDMWGHEWPHDWPTWKVMLDQYIGKLFY